MLARWNLTTGLIVLISLLLLLLLLLVRYHIEFARLKSEG